MMATKIIPPADGAYAYPLLIKQLLLSGVRYEPGREIVYADKLPRPFEFVFNTPSHHRVHHGRDPQYLDKNYGGILIVWDRLFGSYADEVQRPNYGLTKPVGTFNIWTLQTHEYRNIARDVAASRSWKERVGYVVGPPGWTPAAPRERATADSD